MVEMSKQVLTKWEIGQDLISISDFIGEKIHDLNEDGHGDIGNSLDIIRAKVGDLFNKNNDHDFGIFDSDSLDNKEKSIEEIKEWINEEIEKEREEIKSEPANSHIGSMASGAHDKLISLMEFIDE